MCFGSGVFNLALVTLSLNSPYLYITFVVFHLLKYFFSFFTIKASENLWLLRNVQRAFIKKLFEVSYYIHE